MSDASLEIRRDGATVYLIASDEDGGTAYPLEPEEADHFGRQLIAAARDADIDASSNHQ